MSEGLLDALVEGVEGGQFEGICGALDEGGRLVADLGVAATGPADCLNEARGTFAKEVIEINLIYIKAL